MSVSLLKTCAAGQVLAWNGGSWVCSALSIPAGATNGLAYFASPSVVTSTLAPTNGQILIGSTGKAPALGTLTAGPNISIANSAGQITISSSGNVATLPFFTTGGGVITAGKVAGLPNVNTVWGILLPYNVITTQVSYGVAVADNTANTYDLGLYNNSGGLVLDLGPVAGSKFSPTTGLRTLNWAQGATKLSAGRYYLGFTTDCASACAQLSVGALFVSFVSNAPGGHTSGGALPNLMSLPNDSWSSAGQPTVVIH